MITVLRLRVSLCLTFIANITPLALPADWIIYLFLIEKKKKEKTRR